MGWQTQRIEAGRYSGSAPLAVVEATYAGQAGDPRSGRRTHLDRETLAPGWTHDGGRVILRSGEFSRWVRFYSLRLEIIYVFID
jgi:hypothetical protein